MIKRIIYLFACCLMICSFAGCAGNGDDEADTPDVHSLADMLMQNVKFEDSVEEVSSETALRYYGIDSVQVQDSAVYMSTGATAEELAVFQASSTVAAQGILADMKKRRDSQLQMYLDYKSSETARLDDAILYVHDTFVVYMVSDDSETAKGIISDYLE